jgi:hypothetical protein
MSAGPIVSDALLHDRVQRGAPLGRTLLGATVLLVLPFAAGQFALSGADPLFGLLWLSASLLVVLGLEFLTVRSLPAAACATSVGVLFALTVGSAIHESMDAFPSISASQALLAILGLVGAQTLGRLVGRHAAARVGWRRSGALTVGVGAATWTLLAPLVTLLNPGTSMASRLSWILREEDNAHVVGIAREILMNGPSAGRLAEDIGTGFVSAAILGMRTLRLIEGDPRLTAITVFNASTALVIAMLGAGLLLLQISATAAERRPGPVELLLLAASAWAAVHIGLSVAVALPMQTGFLSFVWAMAWLTVGMAVVPLLATPVTRPEGAALVAHVLASAIMVISSWTFLIGGFAPILLYATTRGWRRAAHFIRRRWYAAALVVAFAVVVLAPYFERSLIRQVIGLGRDALLTTASLIEYDTTLFRSVMAGLILGSLFILGRSSSGVAGARPLWSARLHRALLTFGPAAAVGLSWVGLWILAQFLTDGELRYAGTKLAYGFVAVSSLLVFSALVAATAGQRMLTRASVASLLTVALLGSSTVAVSRGWSDRLAAGEPLYVVNVVRTIEQTSLDLPIRCLPWPGTGVSPASQWAAYFCVRWMEDAFNVQRFHGYRSSFLEAEGPTFEAQVEEALMSGRYDFARVLRLEAGWFGWQGR